MRLLHIAIAVLLLQVSSFAQAVPTAEQAGKAAIGGAVGGLLGNQVGNGRGKTIATAAGAATGVVIASGCKVTAGTALGGVLGGLLGSQVGGGNGSNIMAGVGAGVGALLGSDCQPGAEPVAPAPLPSAEPFVINGLSLTPMSGFPQEAFLGIPPIVTPADALAAAKIVRLLTDISASARKDNPELSVLSMYWAKRISTTTLGILSASLSAIQTNKGDSATIPARGLVILPSFNEFRSGGAQHALFDAMNEMIAADSYANTRGILVADAGGLDSIFGLFGKIGAPPPPQQQSAVFTSTVPKVLLGLPLNQKLRLANGTYVLKSADALTVYNPNNEGIELPLDKLDFIPRAPSPSIDRRKAAELMFALNESSKDWAFNVYRHRVGNFQTEVAAPNKLIDEVRGNVAVAYFDREGRIAEQPEDGEREYARNGKYRRAVDTISAVVNSSAVRKHIEACRSAGRGNYGILEGLYANLWQAVCFDGRYTDGNKSYVRTFYIGEGAEVVQTLASMNRDLNNQKAMTEAIVNGGALSDIKAFIPLVGNIESGYRCMGEYTMSQSDYIESILLETAKENGLPRHVKGNHATAIMAGWTPPPLDEWNLDRVINCVSAMPFIGYTGSAVKVADKAANYAWMGFLSDAGGRRIDLLRNITDSFSSPARLKSYVQGVKNVQGLVPDNPSASLLVKTIYDLLMSGENLIQTVGGITTLHANLTQ